MAEDAVQDALLTLHRVRHTFEPGRPVKPWLAAIVSRRAIDATRRRGREAHNELAYETFADSGANEDWISDAPQRLASMASGLSAGRKDTPAGRWSGRV